MFICLAVLLSSCANVEKIGNYKYKIKIHRVNTGEDSGMINYIKSYYLHDQLQAGCIIKSQKLGFEKKSDAIFSRGYTVIKNETKELICHEKYFFSYKFYKNDSIRIFKQENDGRLTLVFIK